MSATHLDYTNLKEKLEHLVEEFDQFRDCSKCSDDMLESFRLDIYRVDHDITSYFLDQQKHLKLVESSQEG
ncbi:hypothetical protein L4C34_03485 [Vibrio profundum]|uniref:hypothetical protein n=1 Tax=Vibrio profundum TaxID=2910247 RepID=UPI003D09962D